MAKRKLNIGLIGYQFMGKAHSNAYRQVSRFFDLDVDPVMKVICGRNQERVDKAAKTFGWEETDTDWERVVQRPDLDIIDVAAPGHLHAPISIAAAKAGKVVLCEKPMANNLAEAKEMAAAVRSAGVESALFHNYRFVPAIALAKQLIDDGKIGHIYHFRGTYLQDWIADPNFPLVWRLKKEFAGSGTHGDLNAHVIDLARHLVGEIAEVSGLMDTFVKQRPILADATGGLAGKAGTEMGEVTVDDTALFLARFENGAIGNFEATRFAPGRKNFNRFEINGSKGSLVFNMERMNEMELYRTDDPQAIRGFRTIQTTESFHPYAGAWWPPGHIIGYEHTFTNLIHDALQNIAHGKPLTPDFEEGLKNQAVLEAVEISSAERRWVSPKSLL
jgi:predicted dehydrogenase